MGDMDDLTSEERWPTMHRLARDLEAAGAPAEMVAKARQGYYDDFHPHGCELTAVQLYKDLRAAGLADMAERVKEGEWDATKAESDAWAASPDGQETFAALVQPAQNRAQRRRASKKNN